MKKLILLLALALMMCGCVQQVLDYGVVRAVEEKEQLFKCGRRTKYIVTVNEFNAEWLLATKVYTNTLYQVGDTIQITKKN